MQDIFYRRNDVIIVFLRLQVQFTVRCYFLDLLLVSLLSFRAFISSVRTFSMMERSKHNIYGCHASFRSVAIHSSMNIVLARNAMNIRQKAPMASFLYLFSLAWFLSSDLFPDKTLVLHRSLHSYPFCLHPFFFVCFFYCISFARSIHIEFSIFSFSTLLLSVSLHCVVSPYFCFCCCLSICVSVWLTIFFASLLHFLSYVTR